jgi:hypothetical protein
MSTDNATEPQEGTARPNAAAAAPIARTRAKPLLASAGIVFALGVAAMIWHSTSRPGPGVVSASHGSDGVKTVVLDGFNGKVTVGVDGSAQVSATAQPVNGNQAPGLEFHLDAATQVLTLACFDEHSGKGPIPCPASEYKVSVPAGMGLTLHLLNGQASLTGLSGPVSITASSAYAQAQGLRTPDFTATITNGTLAASFTSAPAHVSVSVTSAQATLHLPATASYRVRQQATSAYVQVSIPQSATATHSVLATADSGEISLLSS